MALNFTDAEDVWSQWLLHRRHADDPRYENALQAGVGRYAERVLDGAGLTANMTLADVGSGDGVIAFRAIERVGPSLRVLLTDISEPLLRHAEGLALRRNVHRQCVFLQCPADRLEGIGDAAVDVVTTRAVLAYVEDKPAALREFLRILKPGGRISLAEPILQDEAFFTRGLKTLLETRPGASLPGFLPLLHRWKAAQFPDTEEKINNSPIANYSERDLIRFAHSSGFDELHLEFHINVIPSNIPSWAAFLDSSPHPLAPPLSAILAQQFTAQERELFETVMRPVVENPNAVATERIAYLTARKPPK
ncbi:MAG: class I SAM-dependent methyltransferase [Steroidobacteraceae bacterium]